MKKNSTPENLDSKQIGNRSSVNEIHKITKEGLILWNKPISSANWTQTERKYQDNNII